MTRMRIVIGVAGAIALAAIQPALASAQNDELEPHAPNAIGAGVLEWLVPTAGYAYAGDWKAGLVPNAVRVGGLVLFVASYDEAGEQCGSACALGLVAGLGGTLWAIFGAAGKAGERSARVRGSASPLVVGPSLDGGLSVGLRFDW
ncbi:MAG: hypothetical protein AAF389_20085 [Gemmatimonadota bacterium]